MLLLKLTRGSMGRRRAGRDYARLFPETYTSVNIVIVTLLNIVHLPSFHADKLKYVHTDAFGYNKCKLVSTLGAALMEKSMYGEKNA